MPAPAGVQYIKCDLLFRIGDYGWSESYYRAPTAGEALSVSQKKLKSLANLRAKLCGNGVLIVGSRCSNMDVRRDSDDNTLNIEVTSTTETAGNIKITPVINATALLPNVAIVCRVEGLEKVYHASHFLSGVPRDLVKGDQDVVFDAAWNNARRTFKEKLEDDLWCFPALSRLLSYVDRKVTLYNPTLGIVGIDPAWGDIPGTVARWRLINFVKEKGATQRSFVHDATKSSNTQIDFGLNTLPTTWSLGPKSIAHPETTILVPIVEFFDERVSHRNRGRPSDSPRGRRKR